MRISVCSLFVFSPTSYLEDGKTQDKIASNKYWLFLLIEFQMIMPEEFFKVYTWQNICNSSYIGIIM